jgi:hypothetical protein
MKQVGANLIKKTQLFEDGFGWIIPIKRCHVYGKTKEFF